jgi:regulator of replication initiation timing
MIIAASPGSWEVIGIVSGVVSIVLAGFAIWQASVFFRWSNSAQREAEHAAKGVEASVKKLEDVFNRLYSDTFGMMRDTVSDMREHMWSGGDSHKTSKSEPALEEIDKRTSENIEELRREVHEEIAQVINRVGATSDQIGVLEGQLGAVVDQALEASREAQVEAVRETLSDALQSEIAKWRRQGKRTLEADEIVSALMNRFDFHEILESIGELRDQGLVDFEGSVSEIGPYTSIQLPSPRRTRRRKARAAKDGDGDSVGEGDQP